MVIDTWKVNIKGSSMEGLFLDGQTLRAKVWTDFCVESDIHVGKIVILKKKKPVNPHSAEPESHILIIHRIVARFCFQRQILFWEKGDNDYFPKVCYPEEIVAIVTGIEGHPEITADVQSNLWRDRNLKLLKFYQIIGKVYALIEEGRGSRRGILYRVCQKSFWFSFYLLCSFFNLKGQ